jgi:hypothetical protein
VTCSGGGTACGRSAGSRGWTRRTTRRSARCGVRNCGGSEARDADGRRVAICRLGAERGGDLPATGPSGARLPRRRACGRPGRPTGTLATPPEGVNDYDRSLRCLLQATGPTLATSSEPVSAGWGSSRAPGVEGTECGIPDLPLKARSQKRGLSASFAYPARPDAFTHLQGWARSRVTTDLAIG